MFSRHTEFTTDRIEFLDVLFVEFLRSAKELGLIQKLCVELYRLHLHVCSVKVCAPCKCSVVLKKYCIESMEGISQGYPESPLWKVYRTQRSERIQER